MSRYFGSREIELLAPAGTFKDFEEIIKSSADAVYLGGKKFNMRMHRKDYNLTDDEIKTAVEIAHSLNKKVYITFNNMMSDAELEDAEEYLMFLEKVHPDGLIVQDFGAVKKIRDLDVTIPIHLSVMANVHSRQMIDKAQKLGVTRVVTSREMSLETIHSLSQNTSMEFEYFIHGDMCVVHGAQCLYGGVLFGKSSNRGLCMKPCRWGFKYDEEGELCHPLAVKDMSLFRHIPELIQAGVCSFKIEGRMRDSSYLVELINLYGEAIDNYIKDPTGYSLNQSSSSLLHEKRVRNLSTAYAFKKPGAINVDIDGKREPRIFSRAVEEFDISKERIDFISDSVISQNNNSSPLLSVKVNNLEAFKKAIDGGADIVYIAGEVYRKDKPFTLEDIEDAVKYANGKRVYYTLPRMMYYRHFNEYSFLVNKLKAIGVSGILVSNLGQISEYESSGLEMIGDFGINCYNSVSASFYSENGLRRATASIEAPLGVLRDTLEKSSVEMEVIVQGAPTVMYMEHCLHAAKHRVTSEDWCLDFCENEPMDLIDELGNKHPVYADQYCRNHIIASKDLCLLPVIPQLIQLGAAVLRIEGQHYSPEALAGVTSIYRKALDENYNQEDCFKEIEMLKKVTGRGQSLQALNFD